MPHHFTKSTVQAEVWCSRCGKETPWRIADGRRQYCLICYEKRAEKAPQFNLEAEPEQQKLF